jgi:putative endonuclease
MKPCIYILSSINRKVLYVGVTSDLPKRMWQHKNKVTKSFASKYHVHRLVYFELFDDMTNAIAREKSLKKYQRTWKQELIESFNPNWHDLTSTIQ